MTDFRKRIDALRERIQTSEHLDPADKEALLHFSDEMDFKDVEYGDQRHVKLLQHCTVVAGSSPSKYSQDELPDCRLVDAVSNRDELKKIQRWIKSNFDSEETKRDYRVAVRMFAEHSDVVEEKGAADELSAGTPRNYQPMPDPAKMLYWDKHIQPMLKAATNYRDEAAIALAWDLGPRPFEFRDLRVGDITDHKHGMKVTVDGKRGQRSALIIPSAPYVKRWLDAHPAGDNPTAPLWSKLNSAEDISYKMLLKMLKKPARKAGITHTEINLRRMRKSSASYLASQNVNQAHLEDHHGWKRGSDIASRYVAVFGEANDREIARAHGADVEEDESSPTTPLNCPRCSQKTPRERQTCVWCGAALSHEAAEKLEAERQAAMETIREGDEPVADSAMEIERRLGKAPGLRAIGIDED